MSNKVSETFIVQWFTMIICPVSDEELVSITLSDQNVPGISAHLVLVTDQMMSKCEQ